MCALQLCNVAVNKCLLILNSGDEVVSYRAVLQLLVEVMVASVRPSLEGLLNVFANRVFNCFWHRKFDVEPLRSCNHRHTRNC